MNVDNLLGPPRAFGEFLANPAILPEWAWLYTSARGPVILSTECRATLSDSRDLSEGEAEARDAELEKEGFDCLLSRSQIEDIVANLRSRHPAPTAKQLEAAAQFYLAHDAFMVA